MSLKSLSNTVLTSMLKTISEWHHCIMPNISKMLLKFSSNTTPLISTFIWLKNKTIQKCIILSYVHKKKYSFIFSSNYAQLMVKRFSFWITIKDRITTEALFSFLLIFLIVVDLWFFCRNLALLNKETKKKDSITAVVSAFIFKKIFVLFQSWTVSNVLFHSSKI